MDFTNKVVLITGGSRGIGKAIALQFAEAGAKVVINYHSNTHAADQTLGLLQGTGHLLAQADVTDPDAARQLIDTVVQKMGRIDILVNNAGIYEDHAILDVTYSEWQVAWQKIMNANLMSVANLMYCAAQYMIRRGGGHIVNVSSRGSFRGEPTAPAYGASKAAMNALGQSLAVYLAPHNVTVGTVAPGFVETDMAEEILKSPQGEGIRNQSPFKRVAKPEEVAHAVLFLASDEAVFSTGTIIDVNGASYLRG